MNCWQILELAPTDDNKAIKRAYAKLLKQLNPELEPEKFQTLHEAYQQALIGRKTAVETIAVENTVVETIDQHQRPLDANPPASTNERPHLDEYDDGAGYSPAEFDQDIHNYMCDLAQAFNLSQQSTNYKNLENWRVFFTHPILIDLDAKNRLSDQVFEFFAEVTRYQTDTELMGLIQQVLKHYDEIFHWSEDELRLERFFQGEDIDRLMAYIRANQTIRELLSANEQAIANLGTMGYVFIGLGGLAFFYLLIKLVF